MDINGFREAQSPFFFTQPPESLIEIRVKSVELPQKSTNAVPDNRYPEYAGMMNDGRITTDYRSHCEMNLPTGTQYPSRLWMQRNGKVIIQTSRNRQAELAGAGKPYDSSMEVEPIAVVKCTTKQCEYIPSKNPHGIGIERNEDSPPLFATWAPSYPSDMVRDNQYLTTVYEGGRNTPRGTAR